MICFLALIGGVACILVLICLIIAFVDFAEKSYAYSSIKYTRDLDSLRRIKIEIEERL